MLYFLTGALSYATGIGAIQNNKYLKLAILLIIFWAILLSQLKGTKYTSLIARIGFVAGILLPALVLFGLGIHYVASGAPLQTILSMKTLIPDFSKLPTLVVFVSFILAYMGVETSASHANEMENLKGLSISNVCIGYSGNHFRYFWRIDRRYYSTSTWFVS